MNNAVEFEFIVFFYCYFNFIYFNDLQTIMHSTVLLIHVKVHTDYILFLNCN